MGSPSGDMLCAHLAESCSTLSHFKLCSPNSAVCNENQHLPASETKDKYGKMATRGGRRIGLNEFYCITREMAACTCQKNIIFILNEWVYLC